MIHLSREFQGKILDIGGGGEGMIGRLYTSQVIAIDTCQAELDEAPDGFTKILMDATKLDFSEGSFDHVTFFFTMMYLSAREQRSAILEAARVLKHGGELHIWDCEFACAYPQPFCVDLVVQLPEEAVSVTYGIGKLDGQSLKSIRQLCVDAGLIPLEVRTEEWGFYLRFQKP